MANDDHTPQDLPVPEQVQAYLETETKYHACPVPTGLPEENVLAGIAQEVGPTQTPENMEKLFRLAIVYDLTAAANSFGALLAGKEESGEDLARTSWALAALAWLDRDGDGRQKATDYFGGLLERADPREHAPLLMPACDALTPGDGAGSIRTWIEKAIADLDRTIEARESTGDDAVAEEMERDALQEFLAGDLAALDEAGAVRAKVNAVTDPAELIKHLALLHVGDIAELDTWAAYRLIRVTGQQPANRDLAAREFGVLADRFDAGIDADAEGDAGSSPGGAPPPPEKSPPPPAEGEEPLGADVPPDGEAPQPADEAEADRRELELKRARCLRAVLFFGGELDEDATAWLAEQQDHGGDVLALRPDWRYGGLPASPMDR
jgi:hypothetical protein